MLSKEENEVLCRVGPGTAMGNLLREYWFPAVPSFELPSPDCPPKKVRLLGEDLVAFRDSRGEIGLVSQACPHRGASLFFGRNEEAGLRCVYHGWKFDVTGQCLDMPSEPAESNFKSKIRATAYPCRERSGIIWTYMGTRPAENLPLLPDIEANLLAEGAHQISVLYRPGTGSTLGGLDNPARNPAVAPQGGPQPTTGRGFTLPNTTDWFGRFHIEQNAANDYMIDRGAQAKMESWSGIPGVRQQDMAVTE